MPQMAPMSWIFLSPLTIALNLALLALIYFSYFATKTVSQKSKITTKNTPTFKW